MQLHKIQNSSLKGKKTTTQENNSKNHNMKLMQKYMDLGWMPIFPQTKLFKDWVVSLKYKECKCKARFAVFLCITVSSSLDLAQPGELNYFCSGIKDPDQIPRLHFEIPLWNSSDVK